MPPRDLTVLEARRILKAADLRGLRQRAGIKAATMAAALGVSRVTVYSWERHEDFPRGWQMGAYARVITGLAAHEQATEGEEAADAA